MRALFGHYYDLTQQLTRFKNKLKAVFRQEAIPVEGRGVFAADARAAWLRLVRSQPHLHLEALKQETFEKMVRLARQSPAFAWLDSMPGAGPMIATGYLALLETPFRSSRKSKLWTYSGLGQKVHTSDDVVYTENRAGMGIGC